MTLRSSPAIDSAELAAARRRELDIPRESARLLGVSALEAARDGRYVAADGHTVEWKSRTRWDEHGPRRHGYR